VLRAPHSKIAAPPVALPAVRWAAGPQCAGERVGREDRGALIQTGFDSPEHKPSSPAGVCTEGHDLDKT
jgi:hypothetical protein